MKSPEFFSNFKTFKQHGIEFMKVNGRPYRVVKPVPTVMILLPMISAFDEAAKDKHRNSLIPNIAHAHS